MYLTAMVSIDNSSIQADSHPSQLAWSESNQLFGIVLHLSGKLWQ